MNPNTEIVLDRAREIAKKYERRHVCEDCLLLAFFPIHNLSVASIIENTGASFELLFSEANAAMDSKKKCKNVSTKFSQNVKNILAEAEFVSKENGEPLMPMHIFTALALHPPKAFRELEISGDQIIEAFVHFDKDVPYEDLGEWEEPPQFEMFASNRMLDQFAENLNIRAQSGEFDGIVDYDDKCSEMISILSKGQKPNPILVGKSGVGKSSLVYALARKIVNGEVPDLLVNTVIYSLSLSSLVAGTEYRGQFERRLEDFVKELKSYDNIILFIDEIHTLVGAGNSTENGLEASNILKPDLASGKIKCIGATTINEYNATIKKDSALDRRFQRIIVREPSTEEMRLILPTITTYFAEKHSVTYTEKFHEKILHFCDKKLVNRVYPDKVIDVVDYCGAVKKVDHFNVSAEISAHKERILGEDEVPSPKQVEDFCSNVAKIQARLQIRPEVTEEDLILYFEKQSNPLYSLARNERFVDSVSGRFLGQKSVLTEFFDVVTVNSLGFNNNVGIPDSYLFEGEKSGGKTLFCNVLREELQRYGANVIFFDGGSMSNFDIVSPYRNHDNTLAEQILLQPRSIIIIDNFDEMYSDDLIRQIITTGQLNSNGELVDFANCQIIAVCSEKASSSTMGFLVDEQQKSEESNYFQKSFKFKELDMDSVREIVQHHLKEIKKTLSLSGISLNIDDSELEKVENNIFLSSEKGKAIHSIFCNKILSFIASKLKEESKEIHVFAKNIV